MKMAKYIELIDKYRIEQSGDDTDYNPPSYIWADNTGEIVRCENCIHCETTDNYIYCHEWLRETSIDGYCYKGDAND